MDTEAFTTWQLWIHQLTNIQMCKLLNLNQPYYHLRIKFKAGILTFFNNLKMLPIYCVPIY